MVDDMNGAWRQKRIIILYYIVWANHGTTNRVIKKCGKNKNNNLKNGFIYEEAPKIIKICLVWIDEKVNFEFMIL